MVIEYIIKMASFQTITIIVAIVILIITLAFIGVLMYNSKADNIYPPVEPGCPAYWQQQTKDGLVSCMPPAGPPIPGYSQEEACLQPVYPNNSSKMAQCANKNLATTCGWSWAGVTNAGDPCSEVDT